MIKDAFKERMKGLLGEEYPRFICELENNKSEKAVRINRIKAKELSMTDLENFALTPLSYASDGYILENYEGIGRTPEHHAGIFYVQDPGAMASLNALELKEGWRVLDLCAAPGGKSGQAAAGIGDTGFLLSNEFVPKRAKILVGNFERLGIKNAVVTSLDTAEFPKMFDSFFDLVIVDAPCSGEGMFRKSEDALIDWSEENVKVCQRRQMEILNNARSLVKNGGYLLYSTCTYSLEENEMIIDSFLSENREYSLVEVKDELKKITADGIDFPGNMTTSIYKTRRFYPHISRGEGQYIALMTRKCERSEKEILYKDASVPASRGEEKTVEDFFRENLKKRPLGKIRKCGENLVLVAHGIPIPQKSVFSAGVLIGEIRGQNLFPSHHFFSCFGDLFLNRLDLSEDSERLQKYLRGEEIDCRENLRGWCSVIYKGASLGGGKASSGRLKNHYPKGIRLI